MTKDELRKRIGLLYLHPKSPVESSILELIGDVVSALPDEVPQEQCEPPPERDVPTILASKVLLEAVGGEFSVEKSMDGNRIHLDSLPFCTELVVDNATVYPNEAHRLVMERVKAYRDYSWNVSALAEVRTIEQRHVEYFEKHKDGGR